jgi:hypothetical protein
MASFRRSASHGSNHQNPSIQVTFGDFALVAAFAASGENPHVLGAMLKRESSEL